MLRKIKFIVAATTIVIGFSTVSASAQNISKEKVIENSVSQSYASEQSNLLPNSIVYTGSMPNNKLLPLGQIIFNKKDMKINGVNLGQDHELDSTKSWGDFARFDLLNSNLQSKNSLQIYTGDKSNVITKLKGWSFNYGDIISVWQQDTNNYIQFGIASNNEVSKANNDGNIDFSSRILVEHPTYYKITQNGLIEMSGLYTAPNGDKYFFDNGHKVTNRFLNIDTNGNRVNGNPINVYYFGSDGQSEKGIQTIYGKIYNFNSTTGIMVVNKWEIINENKYYFGPNGEAYTGYKDVGGKVYNFNNEGKLQGEVAPISINGINNITVSYGSKFDPMEGVTLNDLADPTAKVTISGTVNTKVPGTYKLTYKVTDKYGKTATVERTVTVEANYNVSINGVNNITLAYGSKFNPMEGVTLNDPADPAAKIAVSGEVNTKILGTHTLTYKVTDKFGKTVTSKRVIIVRLENVFFTENGKTYYYNNRGVKVKGFQKIDGRIYKFNPSTGEMLTNFWETINGSKYYFGPNGYVYKGYKEIDGKFYYFNNEGKLQGEVFISINGANNITVAYGSKFNPMAGIILNTSANLKAKITVLGTVNTKIPGTYKLIYEVRDNLSQTITTIERNVTVEKNNVLHSNTFTKYISWSSTGLVINGNIELNNEIMKKSDLREILIEDSNGNVVATANGAAVNWYSKNKENYSGFQVIFSKSELSKLEVGKQYNFTVKAVVNGKTITESLANTLALPNNSVYSLTTNSNNNLTIFKNSEVINSGVGTYEVGYFTNYGYVLNGNINLKGETLSKGVTRYLLIKDSNGKTVYDVSVNSMNWYSKNKDNYSGFQGIVTNDILNTLKEGEQYSFYVQVKLNGKIYEMKVDNTKGFILSSGINYNIATNKDNTITISKAPRYSVVKEGTGTFENGYWESYGYVMNVKVNLGMNVPKGTKMQLISENELGQVVSVTSGVDVNWYGKEKTDYNGFQAMIIPKQLVEASPTNKLYARVIIDGKAYISPIIGNVNTPIGSSGQKELNYGFKTIDGQVNLIMK